MFGVGWTEMLLIGVVALVVIGPKDLPVVMNRLGKVVATIRRMGSEFQQELNKTTGLDQLTDLRRSITEPLKQTADDMKREFNRATELGTTEPSGVIAPRNPATESIVAEINEKAGMTPVTENAPLKPVMTELAAPASIEAAPAPVESPAPGEAIAPVEAAKPARKPRARRTPVAAATTPVEPVASTPAPQPKAKKPAAPRKPRTPKPEAEA